MNILYSANDKYVPIVGVSIVSLLENNKNVEDLTIYFIDAGLGDASIKMLSSVVAGYKQTIEFIRLDLLIGDGVLNVPNKSYYGRFFGTHIVSDDKILYLDCDLIINGSLKELYSTDLGNYWIAGVQGPGASYECRKSINFPDECRYINSGVLLVNLKEWRKRGVENKLINYLNEHGEIPPYHDQNIINAVCCQNTLILPPEYNLLWSMICSKPKHICKLNKIQRYYSDEEIDRAINKPVIIHFSNSIYGRPWNQNCKHPKRDLFKKYLLLSPWANTIFPSKRISLFGKFRNTVYRIVPSYFYYLLQSWERFIVKHIIPRLPYKKLTRWFTTYMNGR